MTETARSANSQPVLSSLQPEGPRGAPQDRGGPVGSPARRDARGGTLVRRDRDASPRRGRRAGDTPWLRADSWDVRATVAWDSAVAVVAAIVLCAAQAYAVGVTTATAVGAIAGVGLVVALCAMVMTLGVRSCGPADRVTLARVVLIGGCAGLTGPILSGAVPARPWWLLVLLVPALLLDAVDGQVARRTGTSSPAGAKLDGEVDAAALLVLSVIAISSLGWWVLTIGLMRYAFWAAGLFQRALREQLPFSQFRRVAAGLQGASLAVAFASVVPLPDARALVAVALVLLLVSFGRDVVWLAGRRPVSTG